MLILQDMFVFWLFCMNCPFDNAFEIVYLFYIVKIEM